ncbi:MAG: hemin uptake protein HemP [Chromatiaceae bacterium]|nr:hemin uptake protein HemP [Chromatiaceae bacterium]
MPSQIEKDNSVPTLQVATPRVLSSHELFHNGQRIDIEHQGEIYRLQITHRGRLILTK